MDSDIPRRMMHFAVKAGRRADAGELADEYRFPCDSQRFGLLD